MEKWNNRCVHYILLAMFFFMVSCEKDDVEPEKTRTLMVYLDGGGNLSNFMADNIADMAKVWKKGYNANIVIFYATGSSDAKLLTFDIKGKGVEQREIKAYGKMDLTSAGTFGKVLRDMQELYPASSYGLIVGSHGAGWIPPMVSGYRMARSVNVLTRNFGDIYKMDVRDMAQAIPSGMEFILFDACFMSSIEALYEFRNTTKYLIVSPAELPVCGFPYQKVIPYLWGKGDKLADGLKTVCESFHERYNTAENLNEHFGTIALVDARELEGLYRVTRQILQGRKSEVADKNIAMIYRYPLVEYNSDVFFDLGDYIKDMAGATPEDYNEFEAQMKKVVLCKFATDPFYKVTIPGNRFSGISTYIPRSNERGLTDAYWSFPWAGVYE